MPPKTTPQYAAALLIIGAILFLAGGYQLYNPVLAVSEPDDCMTVGILPQISDATLTTDKDTYAVNDPVLLTATGTNNGEATWNGVVQFSITPGSIIQETGVSLTSGEIKSVVATWDLPSEDMHIIQSKWIDDSGRTHAATSILFTLDKVWGIPGVLFGTLAVILGILLLLMGGFGTRIAEWSRKT